MTTISNTPKLSKLFRLQWEEAQQAYVLLYPEGMVKLNNSAAEILKLCDGERTVTDIVKELETLFGQTNLEDDVKEFLEIASQQNWIA